ncbi:MAG: TetR family transcriptional regulator [Lachnospiraceae bacterium]|nr:TetR family transcriptional regulator [Lachnospiraceae bacterium]
MTNRTKLLILHSFNDLLKRNTIEDITTKMIIEKAGVGKTTFYRYFKDKYDVMSFNYDVILKDSFRASSNLWELLYNIAIQFHSLHEKTKNNIAQYKGSNSTNDYIIEASMAFLEDLARRNRNGEGLTRSEYFQSRIIIGGISVTGINWPLDDNDISTFQFCTDELYQLFPESIKSLKFSVSQE